MEIIKKVVSLALVLALLIGYAPIASADEGSLSIPNEEFSLDLKVSTVQAVVGTTIKANFKSPEDSGITVLSLTYQKPSGQQLIVTPEEDDHSGQQVVEWAADEVGIWRLVAIETSANGAATTYDGSYFYGDVEVVQSIADIYGPETTYPVLDASTFDDGMTVAIEDFIYAIGGVRGFDQSGNPLEIDVEVAGAEFSGYYSIYNDGLSLETQTESALKPALGHYTATFHLEGAKSIERSFSVVADTAQASFIRLAADEKVYTSRLSGGDRFTTATAVSKSYRGQSDNVILVTSHEFADALAAASIAGQLKAPILYTWVDGIQKDTLAEINRLGAKNIYIIGGTSRVGQAQENELKKTFKVTRIVGGDRFETAVKVAQTVGTIKKPTKAFLVNFEKAPDALTAGSMASMNGYPILYTLPGAIPANVRAYLTENAIEEVIIVGGNEVVTPAAESAAKALVKKVTRIAGTDRYDTAATFAKNYFKDATKIVVASGENGSYPDALSAGPFAGSLNAPVLLTAKGALPKSIGQYIDSLKVDQAFVTGGGEVVTDGVFNAVNGQVKTIVAKLSELSTQKDATPAPTPVPTPAPAPKAAPAPAPKPAPVAVDTKPVVKKIEPKYIAPRKPTADKPIKIMLDPGHGWRYNQGIDRSYFEGEMNIKLSYMLKAELQKYGFVVGITRSKNGQYTDAASVLAFEKLFAGNHGHSSINNQIWSLKHRGEMGEGYDLLLSVHSNAISSSSTRGTEIFDSVTRPNKALADVLCKTIVNAFGHNSRGVKYKAMEEDGDNWYGILRFSRATHSMLVEHGFHSNSADVKLLKDDAFLQKMAAAEAKAIANYYGVN